MATHESIDVTIKTGVAPYSDGCGFRIDVEIKAVGSSTQINMNDMHFDADFWPELRALIDHTLARIADIRQPRTSPMNSERIEEIREGAAKKALNEFVANCEGWSASITTSLRIASLRDFHREWSSDLAALTAANERAQRAEAENERLREALVEIRDSNAPDHHVPQYQHCVDVARRALEAKP